MTRRTERSTATDITDILNNADDPESMMLSSKRSISDDINNTPNQPLMISDDEEVELELDKNTSYNIRSFDDNNMINPTIEDNAYNINSKYYATTNNNNAYFAMSGSPNSGNNPINSTSSKNEKCMRRILQFTFGISTIFFISPFFFFVSGYSQIISQYAKLSVAVRKHGDEDDEFVKDLWHFPSVHNICTQGDGAKYYCIRYIFFLIYVILFTIMFICCVSLFAIRKQKHPLKLIIIISSSSIIYVQGCYNYTDLGAACLSLYFVSLYHFI